MPTHGKPPPHDAQQRQQPGGPGQRWGAEAQALAKRFVPRAALERGRIVDVGERFTRRDRLAEEGAERLPSLDHIEDKQPVRRSRGLYRLLMLAEYA